MVTRPQTPPSLRDALLRVTTKPITPAKQRRHPLKIPQAAKETAKAGEKVKEKDKVVVELGRVTYAQVVTAEQNASLAVAVLLLATSSLPTRWALTDSRNLLDF